MEVVARVSSFRFSEGRLLAKVQFACPSIGAPHNLLETREIDVTGADPDELGEKLYEHICGYSQNAALVEKLRFIVDQGIPFKLPEDPLEAVSPTVADLGDDLQTSANSGEQSDTDESK